MKTALFLCLVTFNAFAADYSFVTTDMDKCTNLPIQKQEQCALAIKSKIDAIAISNGATKNELKKAWNISKHYLVEKKPGESTNGPCEADTGNPNGYGCALSDYAPRVNR